MSETTQLQAVNTMLSCIGEAPVSTLTSPTSADVVIAIAILDEVSREVQSRGGQYNTIYNQSISRDGSNKIPLPSTWLSCDHDDYSYVKQGGFLWDADNSTDVFSADVTALSAIVELAFDKIPEPVRRYIVTRASRTFFERMVGEPNRAQMLRAEEEQAQLHFLHYESEQDDNNIFANPYISSRLRARNRGITR